MRFATISLKNQRQWMKREWGIFDSEENQADLATKVIHGGYKRDHLVSKVLHEND
jgi:hypothetical protein